MRIECYLLGLAAEAWFLLFLAAHRRQIIGIKTTNKRTQTPTNKPTSCGVERSLPLPETGDFTVGFSIILSTKPTNKRKVISNFYNLVIHSKILLLSLAAGHFLSSFNCATFLEFSFVMFHEDNLIVANKLHYFYKTHFILMALD